MTENNEIVQEEIKQVEKPVDFIAIARNKKVLAEKQAQLEDIISNKLSSDDVAFLEEASKGKSLDDMVTLANKLASRQKPKENVSTENLAPIRVSASPEVKELDSDVKEYVLMSALDKLVASDFTDTEAARVILEYSVNNIDRPILLQKQNKNYKLAL